eukprot:13156860-Alexandrium_andersonii.AAC.1
MLMADSKYRPLSLSSAQKFSCWKSPPALMRTLPLPCLASGSGRCDMISTGRWSMSASRTS